MSLIANHPDLPPLPLGQFWRIGFKSSGLGFKYVQVQLRRHFLWFSLSIQKEHAYDDLINKNAKDTAVWLAQRINKNQTKLKTKNRLGDLEGDHP